MARSIVLIWISVAIAFSTANAAQSLADTHRKVEQATNVLNEMLNAPAKGIPLAMLGDAQGVVIIPEVIKVGFLIGVQRGEGVLLVRQEDGSWSLPKFVTITAGSFGWQLGAESSDFVLVFKTRRSIDGLMKGKFTIGADANAAIGPVGRQIGAATDAKLSAEIYTYSRSRGLFAGVSLAGSALELDPAAEGAFYGSWPPAPPARVPDSAAKLVALVTKVSGGGVQTAAADAVGMPQDAAVTVERARRAASDSAKNLYAVLDDQWRRYLGVPEALFTADQQPEPAALRAALSRFDALNVDAKYRTLTTRPEYTAAQSALGNYYNALSTERAPLNLPPPPDSAVGPALR